MSLELQHLSDAFIEAMSPETFHCPYAQGELPRMEFHKFRNPAEFNPEYFEAVQKISPLGGDVKKTLVIFPENFNDAKSQYRDFIRHMAAIHVYFSGHPKNFVPLCPENYDEKFTAEDEQLMSKRSNMDFLLTGERFYFQGEDFPLNLFVLAFSPFQPQGCSRRIPLNAITVSTEKIFENYPGFTKEGRKIRDKIRNKSIGDITKTKAHREYVHPQSEISGNPPLFYE